MPMSNDERSRYAEKRRERIYTYMTQDPPVPLAHIMQMEGLTERPLRKYIRELELEYGITYIHTPGTRGGDSLMPYGLSDATVRFRSNLGDELFKVTGPTNDVGVNGRVDAAPHVGLNPREQIRAEGKPFNHDWTLSQMERLARTLGEDPREFILKCLTT